MMATSVSGTWLSDQGDDRLGSVADGCPSDCESSIPRSRFGAALADLACLRDPVHTAVRYAREAVLYG